MFLQKISLLLYFIFHHINNKIETTIQIKWTIIRLWPGNNYDIIKGLFGIAVSISAILKIVFLKIAFSKSLLFKIAKVFGKTC
jgi:hypothetical protein